MSGSDGTAGRLTEISQENPGWVLTPGPGGSFTACRPWFGSQQVFTVPGLDELDDTLRGIRGRAGS